MVIKDGKNNGFTLIEVVVVTAIIMALSGVFVPKILKIMLNSQIAADQATLSALNKSTTMYGIDKTITNNDIFDGIELDEERMQELVEKKYLDKIGEPKQKDVSFNWDIDDQVWVYNSDEESESTSDMISYSFGELSSDGFLKKGTWNDTSEDGFESDYGLLFIENDNSEYTVTTTAILSEGTNGGYGILFETSLTDNDVNKDTGYVLQFDRGLNSIVIRERTEGSESSPILEVDNSDNSIIPDSNSDDWWSKKHEITLAVTEAEGDGTNKEVDVYIDNELIIDSFAFSSDVEAENNFTGFRSWHKETTYESLTIQ
jgi:prepilin-type N-terminal cleavage/methylation domain-containing protein